MARGRGVPGRSPRRFLSGVRFEGRALRFVDDEVRGRRDVECVFGRDERQVRPSRGERLDIASSSRAFFGVGWFFPYVVRGDVSRGRNPVPPGASRNHLARFTRVRGRRTPRPARSRRRGAHRSRRGRVRHVGWIGVRGDVRVPPVVEFRGAFSARGEEGRRRRANVDSSFVFFGRRVHADRHRGARWERVAVRRGDRDVASFSRVGDSRDERDVRRGGLEVHGRRVARHGWRLGERHGAARSSLTFRNARAVLSHRVVAHHHRAALANDAAAAAASGQSGGRGRRFRAFSRRDDRRR